MSRPPLEIAKTAQELFAPFEIFQREAEKAGELAEKLENQQITISVIGQFKRGKSTLVNAILQDQILPVGIVPVTAVVTEIKYGEKAADIHFENGVIKPAKFEELSKYINEQENPENKLAVKRVSMYSPSEFLKGGITFVDTPGVGSVHTNNTDAAYAFVKESDAVIFMLSVDSPINQIEIDFLKNARAYASKFYFAVNKIDVISPEELEAYMAYCKKLLCELMDVQQVVMFPVSSKTGQGIEELKETISQDCKTSLKDILSESVRMKMKDLIAQALTQTKLYRNALSMPVEDLDENFRKTRELIKDMTDKAQNMAKEIDQKSEDLKKGTGNQMEVMTWHFIKSNEIEATLNDMKNQISAMVSQLFGIDYHYQIQELDFMKKGMQGMNMNIDVDQASKELKDKILGETTILCEEMEQTLNAVFMYREENAYIVIRRIEDLNKLVRHLRSLQVRI